MPRHFNTEGPCDPADHYMLPTLQRLPAVFELIAEKKYFVVHAPRQVGKTTTLRALARELTHEGRYAAITVSMEKGSPFGATIEQIGPAEHAILGDWREEIVAQLPPELAPPVFPAANPGDRIGAALATWSAWSPRPLVVFLDEIDSLRGAILDSVLRQLRSGYNRRPTRFPWSLALVGLRDIRDYLIGQVDADERGARPSPFNIVARSLTLRDFTADEVAALYLQHSADTGQVFTAAALSRAFVLTQGQPWLVNALASLLVRELVPDRTIAIEAPDVERARDLLIQRQQTHLDSLTERLREPRVRAIVEPMLAGETAEDLPVDDIRFVIDLGLLRMNAAGGLEVANPIYREVILKDLAFSSRTQLPALQPSWLDRSGRLDPERLLAAFLDFWRLHGEILLGTAPYPEVAPHLVLMAFLDRVVNGGGTLTREYAIGSGRMDLCLRHGSTILGIELKVWRERRPDPLRRGLEQLDAYLAGLDLDHGWLIIFDCRSRRRRLELRTSATIHPSPGGRTITVIRA